MPGSFGWTQREPPLYNFAVGLDTLNEILTFDLRLVSIIPRSKAQVLISSILTACISGGDRGQTTSWNCRAWRDGKKPGSQCAEQRLFGGGFRPGHGEIAQG